MKKITVLASAVLSIVLYAAPQILRPEIVPGFSGNVPQLKYEKSTPAPEYNAAGTLAFFLRPEGWDNSDNAWHFFCNNSKAGDKTLMIYRFANGNTRILLKKDKDNLADIIAKIPFANASAAIRSSIVHVGERYINVSDRIAAHISPAISAGISTLLSLYI